MQGTDSMYIKIDLKLKAAAEAVLSRLGLTLNDAINAFLNQVVLRRGLPFEVKIPPADKG